jgi:hypothetical protein
LARLEKAREKSGRTLTGEITERLKQSFSREVALAINDVSSEVDTLAQEVGSGLKQVREELQKLRSDMEELRMDFLHFTREAKDGEQK